ncbi:unnamed protein product [Prunus brigantina]
MGDNAFQLELPPYMHMYLVINGENLKLFEPSLLDDDPNEDTRLPSVDDLKIEREDPLQEDCILEQKCVSTLPHNSAIDLHNGFDCRSDKQLKYFSILRAPSMWSIGFVHKIN